MKSKLIYRISIGLISAMMVFSAYSYFTNPVVVAGFDHLGFPSFFRVELAIAKLIGVGVLLLPFVPNFLKEWAFAGFIITFISAFIAHAVNGDPASAFIGPLLALTLIITAYIYHRKLHSQTV